MSTDSLSTGEPLGSGLAEPPDRYGAFPRLNARQRERLRAIGQTRAVETGEVLFREGEPDYDFFVIESGAVAIVEGYAHGNRVIGVHRRHCFLGDLNLLTGAPPFLSAVVRDAGEVIQGVVLADSRTGARRELECRALFVFIGADPHTDWLRGHVAMDEHCFLLTGHDVQGEDLVAYAGEPFFLETSRPGIFAVGDVRSGSIKRVASGVGEGSMAVRLVHQRLAAV